MLYEVITTIKGKVAAEAAGARKTLRSETEALANDIAAKLLGRSL